MAAETSPPDIIRVVSQLLEMSDIDTVYRDLYLQRARRHLSRVLSYQEYQQLSGREISIDNLLRQTHQSLEQGNWRRVKELSDRVHVMREEVKNKHHLLKVGTEIYDAVAVPLNCFSPGFKSLLGVSERDLSRLRERALENLSSLEQQDAESQAFYSKRRAHFEDLPLDSLGGSSELPDPARLRKEALSVLERGDVDRLSQLAEQMLHPRLPYQTESGAAHRELSTAKDLSFRFPATTLAKARECGLTSARADADRELHGYVSCCCAWQLTFMEHALTPRRRRTDSCTCAHPCPPHVPETLKENLDLLMVHPFVDSSGVRYLPSFAAEDFLVEGFSENDVGSNRSELLSALGLPARVGVSRLVIEHAVLEHGSRLVRLLDLDPQEFRLVCIPFDLYARVGKNRGWGQRKLWTHFDGYQVIKDRRLNALVGGSVEFGGLYDLCSISREDERENVVARFCVVRRERLSSP